MARSLSNLVFKWLSFPGSASRPATIAPASFYPSGMRYNTSVPNEPDTNDDFKPTNKLESSDLSLKDLVEQDVKDNPVMLYMKGVPELPQCGFSSLAVKVLKLYQVPLASRNILEDPELKSAVKAFRDRIRTKDCDKLSQFGLFDLEFTPMKPLANVSSDIHQGGVSRRVRYYSQYASEW